MENRAKVALVPVQSYDVEEVTAAVRTGLELIGGLASVIRPEEKILLKPNLLKSAAPEQAVTTHPAVMEGVIRVLQESGYSHLSYGDSPGMSLGAENAAAAGGLKPIADKYRVPMGDFDNGAAVAFPEGKSCKSFYISNAISEADCIVNLCKMKTHMLERITGAMKNMYGSVTSIHKGAMHVAYPNQYAFADMICDLHRLVKPRLHIMDGIIAMEGNGPASGTPVPMNVMLFSVDPVALDTVFASLVYLDPALVPTCVSGAREQLGIREPSLIDVLTPDGTLTVADAAARYGKPDFDVFRGKQKATVTTALAKLPFMQSRPVADNDKCVACGICEKACPVPGKAVHSGNGKKAVYDYSKCIRCYCCQEMCPAKAISAQEPLLKRIFGHKK